MSGGPGPVVVVSMPETGHNHRLLPLVEAFAARRDVHVFGDAAFRAAYERRGARFHDLFGAFPLDAADARSMPVPCRYVSYAGAFAEPLAQRVAALAPERIVYESFAVIGPAVARRLGVPAVHVCGGHAMTPERALRKLARDPRVAIAPECEAAAARLRDDFGMADASPFSFATTLSPLLNVYGEPPEFLPEADRKAFEPLAFFGSLSPPAGSQRAAARPRGAVRRVYVSFGTIVWRYYADAARAALRALADAFARRDVEVTISLGGHALAAAERAALERPNVRVADSVDQWALLGEVDAFVTHHGLNSTHEAVYQRVPLVSYPFFGDQPGLARRCQALGLAVPLADGVRAPVGPDAPGRALAALDARRDAFAKRLEEARGWEQAVIDGRPAVVERILAAG